MGLNLNLTNMLGLPAELACPRCGVSGPRDFDDYDVECGNPNPLPGQWALRCYCHACEHEWTHRFDVYSVRMGVPSEKEEEADE